MKGCAFFAALFLLGVGLLASGIVVDVIHGGIQVQDAEPGGRQQVTPERDLARKLEVGGIAVAFAAIFGAAGWRFYVRLKQGDFEQS